MTVLASGPFIDWEQLTGQSKFVVDIVSIPIFSAIAGVLTNWTGVLMLFAPLQFRGFRVPGLKTLYPYFPRRVQVLPTFAEGGRLGFQGFIPARAEKMASICVDKAIARIGNVKDFVHELDPDGIADYVAKVAHEKMRPMVNDLMTREHPDLWNALPEQAKELAYRRIEKELPTICRRAFNEIGDNVDELIDVKLFAIHYLSDHGHLLENIIRSVAAPELRFMVKIGLLGFPFGVLLALYLQVHHRVPVLHYLPAWLIVVLGAAVIGVVVNLIAMKMVFEPADPQPRWRYLWRQALLAKRQNAAAADFAHALAYEVLTLPNIANELLYGPRGDKTIRLLERMVEQELTRILGAMRPLVRTAVGRRRFEAIQVGAGGAALDLAPAVLSDNEFSVEQAEKIDVFATRKLRELAPSEFMEMFYASVEQDAWLLYLHGGVLGLGVGIVHIAIFGA